MGFKNDFNGVGYFHHNFYLKTGVSKNGLSLGYSEQDTSSVVRNHFMFNRSNKTIAKAINLEW